jgi:chromosome partitioning protein
MAGKIFVVTNQKGGSGKTTTAVNIAGALSHLGYSVVVVDVDAEQASAATWAAVTGELPFKVIRMRLSDVLPREIVALTADHDFVVVDGVPNKDKETIISLLGIADVGIVPMKPTPLDYWSSVDFLREAQGKAQQINPTLKMALLFVMVNKSRKNLLSSVEGMIRDPKRKEYVFKNSIGDRSAIASVPAVGLTICDLPGKAYEAAREELFDVTKEVLKLVGK